ncbi:hypothetical protein [Actinacidiphila bryophytorum]|uniref:Uncharacterized protein n=1 Tax=Actinacidiphila bryophytorum TaxID=1436133 RepID=A0A9W4EDS7_9ACTN|nr:hypothetical protein [Actinacidiphila bryophytorum]CAG7628567.1 conserved hypothetical protein [Actinacidiphila bryophytorum]
MGRRILTSIRISEHTLKDAWQQLAEACGLPDATVLPPTGSSPEQYGRHVGDPGGLFLVVDDGTVRGHRSPYQEVFATRDLDLALYFAAQEAVGGLAGDAAPRQGRAWRTCARPAATPGRAAVSGSQATGYARGRAPYYRGGRLDFLNRAIRRAELDHPEVADEFELYFHALETGLGLRLPQQAFLDGTVRAAPWQAQV